MSKVVARTLFNTTVVERSWKNYVTSGLVHAVVIGAAFLVAVPAVQVLENPVREHVTLLAPLPEYHAQIEAPKLQHQAKLIIPAIPPSARPLTPPVLPPPEPKPIVKSVPPPAPPRLEPRIEAEAKPAPPPEPKPVIRTGSFQDLQASKAEVVPKQVVVGGFGDPRGVQKSETPKPSPVLMARVGSFESPVGAGQSGGGGHLDDGAVKASGFGNAGVPNGAPNSNGNSSPAVRTGSFGNGSAGGTQGHTGSVRLSGFGDLATATPVRHETPAGVAAFTPVEILFKPRPSYSPEARSLRLEGEVSLQVVFLANGSVKVIRVIKGLGHGLDEAAEQAASQVRFKPAMRSGAPIDTNATISITFELT